MKYVKKIRRQDVSSVPEQNMSCKLDEVWTIDEDKRYIFLAMPDGSEALLEYNELDETLTEKEVADLYCKLGLVNVEPVIDVVIDQDSLPNKEAKLWADTYCDINNEFWDIE